MKISYLETYDNEKIYERTGETQETIKNPITITVNIEIDKKKYEKLQAKYSNSLADRIFTYFGRGKR